MGPIEISEGKSSENDIEFLEQLRQRWNIERGGPPVGSMDDIILERGGHGHEFIIDFIIYAISTCIVANANGTCHFCVLKYLHNVNEIRNYNWCGYVIKCFNNALFYLDRVEFKAFTVDLQQYLKELDEVQDQQGISIEPFTIAAAKEQQCPYCPHCKEKFQSIIPIQDEPIDFRLSIILKETRT
ncbi:hypothetical protein Cgig2_010214 [Carnegiea gigantea]|uniref:Uncharacterized protein n=1 Tax=Carnegiea gigantea TaxID=171969 RepID=A0A9Q1JUD1_9CARY|nr:hypothetical protein Cgig2_010214 [Carnegiea gigantea]